MRKLLPAAALLALVAYVSAAPPAKAHGGGNPHNTPTPTVTATVTPTPPPPTPTPVVYGYLGVGGVGCTVRLNLGDGSGNFWYQGPYAVIQAPAGNYVATCVETATDHCTYNGSPAPCSITVVAGSTSQGDLYAWAPQ